MIREPLHDILCAAAWHRVYWLALLPLLALPVPAGARTVNADPDPSRRGSAYTLTVTPVVELVLSYSPGRAVTCATSNLSPGADPILHILEHKDLNGPVVELARDDDSGGGFNARVSFRTPAAGRVRLVVRASENFTGGKADLTCTGFQSLRGIAVGGAFKRVENYRSRERITTVPLPGGPFGVKAYVINFEGRIVQRALSQANGSAVLANTIAPVSNFTLTQFRVMLGSHPGTIRLVAAGGGGGLPGGPVTGDALPPSAHPHPGVPTSPGAIPPIAGGDVVGRSAGAGIVEPPDPAGAVRLVRNDAAIAGVDPDNDGLGAELEAHIGTCSTRAQVAMSWQCSRSIDPRDTDGDGLTDRAELMGVVDQAPHQFLPRWGADPRHKDLFIEVDFGLANPGGMPRKLSRNAALEMAAIYGDIEQDSTLRVAHARALNNPDMKPGVSLHFDTGVAAPAAASIMELTTYGDWGGYSIVPPVCAPQCSRADPREVRQTSMHNSRWPLFHYALGDPSSGGQAGNVPWLNIPLGDTNVASHELGHTLGLDHAGPAGIGRDANCKPNYPSLMNYAYLGNLRTFSDGFGGIALNNTRLVERGAVSQPGSPASGAYLAKLRDVFKFNVDLAAGDVDWNRDGAMSGSPVRAYANNNHTGCEYSRTNAMMAAGLSDGAPALTRLAGRTFVFYVDERDRKIHAETTDDALACPLNGTSCGPPLIHRAIEQPWNTQIIALDAWRIAGDKLLIVFRTAGGLFETTATRDLAWTSPVPISTSVPSSGEISLAGDDTTVWLAFRDNIGQPRVMQRLASGTWNADEIVVEAGGFVIGPLAPASAPGLLLARGVLYGAFPVGPIGTLRLYQRDPISRRWSSPWITPAAAAVGKPALAFEAVDPASPLPGRMRILYLQPNAGGPGIHLVRMQSLEAIGLGAGARKEMVDEMHDNVWYYGKGVDLLYEEGVDLNLRAVVATAIIPKPPAPPAPHTIQFRPVADGVVNFTYRNWNDWEAMGIGLCIARVKGGANVNCLAWPYTPQSPTAPSSPPLEYLQPNASQAAETSPIRV